GGQGRAENGQPGTVKKSCPRLDRGLDLASFFVAHVLLLARLHACIVNAGRWGRFPSHRRIAARSGVAGRRCARSYRVGPDRGTKEMGIGYVERRAEWSDHSPRPRPARGQVDAVLLAARGAAR